jgi:hypothetical protein
VQLYSSAENEKEAVHILYKTKYENEIGNLEFNLHVHNTTVDDIWIITSLLSRDVIVFPINSEIMTQKYLSGQDSIVCYWKNGQMLLSLYILHLLM